MGVFETVFEDRKHKEEEQQFFKDVLPQVMAKNPNLTADQFNAIHDAYIKNTPGNLPPEISTGALIPKPMEGPGLPVQVEGPGLPDNSGNELPIAPAEAPPQVSMEPEKIPLRIGQKGTETYSSEALQAAGIPKDLADQMAGDQSFKTGTLSRMGTGRGGQGSFAGDRLLSEAATSITYEKAGVSADKIARNPDLYPTQITERDARVMLANSGGGASETPVQKAARGVLSQYDKAVSGGAVTDELRQRAVEANRVLGLPTGSTEIPEVPASGWGPWETPAVPAKTIPRPAFTPPANGGGRGGIDSTPYVKPDDVKADLRAGKLTRDQALQILREKFHMK